MQRTINIDNGPRVTIKVRRATYRRNHAGWIVWVNDRRFKFNTLTATDAVDRAFAAWAKGEKGA